MPLLIDLCAGNGTWEEAFRKRNWKILPIDLRLYRNSPPDTITADVRRLHGKNFPPADLIVASPPCQGFSYCNTATADREYSPDLSIVRACFTFAWDNGAPIVLENVGGLQRWLGPSAHHFGKTYLWGNGVPVLLPPGPRWKEKIKMLNTTAMSRSKIPAVLSEAIATYHTSRLVTAAQSDAVRSPLLDLRENKSHRINGRGSETETLNDSSSFPGFPHTRTKISAADRTSINRASV